MSPSSWGAETLKSLLTEGQWQDFEKNRAFTLKGSNGALYRLHLRGYGHNNIAIGNGVEGTLLGAHPRFGAHWDSVLGGEPEDAAYAQVIAQYLMLRYDADSIEGMSCRDYNVMFPAPKLSDPGWNDRPLRAKVLSVLSRH